jgi:MFS superfamily sulfate permease-like transporter
MQLFNNIKQDLPASIIVFFVALPLCLGIALASGAPLFSGVIAGIVGGVVVGAFSGSPLGVSGPAAGLAVVVFTAIQSLGGWEPFLVAVILAGVFQILLGFLRAGFIAYFFPSSVIKGMLAGIGLIIIIKQFPHAVGYDLTFEGDETLPSIFTDNIQQILLSVWDKLTPGAILIALVSLAILLLWDLVLSKKSKFFQILQGPIVVVGVGIILAELFTLPSMTFFALEDAQLVRLPDLREINDIFLHLTMPDFSSLTNPELYKIAFVMALIASVETLLCVEATDKLDPYKRVTPTNRELKAQGLGNVISGFLGGLPITQVIVRSSANITFGARSKLSAILHGVFLFISVMTISQYLNMIPLASLAAILMMVGYKLTKWDLYKQVFHQGYRQFLPFLVTVVAILLTNLLSGIITGVIVSLAFTLYQSYLNSHYTKESLLDEKGKEVHYIQLADQVSFFSKASIIQQLEKLPNNCKVIIDASQSHYVDPDITEVIENFQLHASFKNIEIETKGI